jgi:hypothetical protein
MTVLVASIEAGAGRTAVTLALAKAAADRERDVGYTKPAGTSPGTAAGGTVGLTDADVGAMLEAGTPRDLTEHRGPLAREPSARPDSFAGGDRSSGMSETAETATRVVLRHDPAGIDDVSRF